MTLLALLRDQGFQAEGFASGRRGLEGIEALVPDVIISDIAMPSPNGWGTPRAGRGRGKKPAAPPLMIAISGQFTKAADRLLAQAAGFDYFLTKPCDPQVL